MSLREVECHVLSCDFCEDEYEIEGVVQHCDRSFDAFSLAQEDGWALVEGWQGWSDCVQSKFWECVECQTLYLLATQPFTVDDETDDAICQSCRYRHLE